jgi:hypothetical protein
MPVSLQAFERAGCLDFVVDRIVIGMGSATNQDFTFQCDGASLKKTELANLTRLLGSSS